MASKQSDQLVTLYKSWTARLGANPDMPLDEMRAIFEHLGDVTAEPGSVDYIETNAPGVLALWGRAEGLCRRPRAALFTWRRLRCVLDVLAPQTLWTSR